MTAASLMAVRRRANKKLARRLVRHAATKSVDIWASVQLINVGLEGLLADGDKKMVNERAKVSSTMQGLSGQVDTLLESMSAIAAMVRDPTEDLDMQSGEEFYNAIMISDDDDNDDDGTDDDIKPMEIIEPRGIMTKSSRSKEDYDELEVKQKIKQERQIAGGWRGQH
jgi:hypothetical protein